MSKVVEIKKNITSLGWLAANLNSGDFAFLLVTLEDLLYLAVLETQSFQERSEEQGAYRVGILNLHSHTLIKLEFNQADLGADHKQRQLAHRAIIGAIVKDKAHAVLITNGYKSADGTNLLISIQIKDFGISACLRKDAIDAYANDVEDAFELISWKQIATQGLAYQDYLQLIDRQHLNK